MTPFKWQSYSVPIVIPAKDMEPTYGWVKHPSRPHWRNYKRAIPGGTTFVRILTIKALQAKRDTVDRMKADLFGKLCGT